ncbi:MAG: phosphoribosyltransferase family protein, partial [candidate division Zixibacteria bacterium]|nr:phosphoribosyltransferase family protein [candidate division Zixibacteria bacterium]
LILDVLKDDVSITDFAMDRMCDLLTDKFISGDLSSDDPIQEIFNEKELLHYINEMEIHKDALRPGDKVILVDDLIATGGTLAAACKLVEKLGGKVVGISSVIGLDFLPYKEKLKGYDVNYLISYDSE